MKEKRKINLEDLGKKQVFTVPDGYFEQLPGQISHKVQVPRSGFAGFCLPAVARYGMAVMSLCLIVLAAYLILRPSGPEQSQPEAILSQVSGQEIMLYLQQSDVSQYDLVEKASAAGIILDNNTLEEVEITRDILLEQTDSELLEELI